MTATATARAIRISRRVSFFLSGSQAAFDQKEDAYELFQRILTPKTRKDGSLTVELSAAEADLLAEYIEAMAAGAADNAWDPDGLADLNAARACLRALQVT